MNEPLLINQIFVFLIVTIGLWLAFWVLFTNKKARVNQCFFVMTILIILWSIFAYLGFIAIEIEKATIWYRLNGGMVSLFFLTAYFFSIYFPKKITENYFLSKIIIFLCSIFFFFSIFTDLVIKETIIKEWGVEIIFGPLGGFVFKGFSFLLTLIILYYLFKKYFFILEKKEKLKTQYIIMGVSIFALTNTIFNIIFPLALGTVRYQHFGDFSAIFFLGFTAYAIVKHQLFEIKVVMTSLFVALIAILLAVDLFVFTPQLLYIQILKGVALIIFLFFGYLLIKSVIQEIKRREELEKLTTQLEVAHIRLSAANVKLQKIDKTKSEFISIASHQLRTPLTAIKGYISMILEGTYGELSEKSKKPMENIYLSNERLIKLVNDLLNLSRLEAGKIEFKPELCSLEKIIQDIVDELKINAQKKGLKLKLKLSKNLPQTIVDENKLRQVLLNILDNAIKYTQKGEITIELEKIDNEQQIKISDTGEGMTKDEIESIFQTFSRTTAGNQLNVEGAGIGLYVGKKFIEMHKGKIWAESPGKNKGSTFYVRLPHISNQ